MGCAERTVLTNVSLLAVVRNLPFHPGILAPIFSISGCTSILRSLLKCRGNPRYLAGKLHTFPGKLWRSCVTVLCGTLMGNISVFDMLILSPEHSPKKFSILCRCSISKPVGAAKMAASSAYKEHQRLAALGNTGDRIPWSATSWMIRCNGSMASMKSIGDNGSPCLSPRSCFICCVGFPLINTLEVAEPNRTEIQSLHLVLKPNLSRTSRRKFQLIESNALEMSSLMKRDGIFFFLCSSCTTLCA